MNILIRYALYRMSNRNFIKKKFLHCTAYINSFSLDGCVELRSRVNLQCNRCDENQRFVLFFFIRIYSKILFKLFIFQNIFYILINMHIWNLIVNIIVIISHNYCVTHNLYYYYYNTLSIILLIGL